MCFLCVCAEKDGERRRFNMEVRGWRETERDGDRRKETERDGDKEIYYEVKGYREKETDRKTESYRDRDRGQER